MKVKLSLESQQLTKEELQLLIQGIRDCEQESFPDKEIAIGIEAPELSAQECQQILASIKPPSKYKYGLLVVSVFLVHAAGAWAYIFFRILRDGEILLYEPNRPWLMAEFGMAVVWTMVGIFFLVVTFLGLKKQADRRRKAK